MKKCVPAVLTILALVLGTGQFSRGEDFSIGIMQDAPGVAKK